MKSFIPPGAPPIREQLIGWLSYALKNQLLEVDLSMGVNGFQRFYCQVFSVGVKSASVLTYSVHQESRAQTSASATEPGVLKKIDHVVIEPWVTEASVVLIP